MFSTNLSIFCSAFAKFCLRKSDKIPAKSAAYAWIAPRLKQWAKIKNNFADIVIKCLYKNAKSDRIFLQKVIKG